MVGKEACHLSQPAAVASAQKQRALKVSSSFDAAEGLLITAPTNAVTRPAQQAWAQKLNSSSGVASGLPHAAQIPPLVSMQQPNGFRITGSFEAAMELPHAANVEAGTAKARGPGKGWRKGTRGMLGRRGDSSRGNLGHRGRGGRSLMAKATLEPTKAAAALKPGDAVNLNVHIAPVDLQAAEVLDDSSTAPSASYDISAGGQPAAPHPKLSWKGQAPQALPAHDHASSQYVGDSGAELAELDIIAETDLRQGTLTVGHDPSRGKGEPLRSGLSGHDAEAVLRSAHADASDKFVDEGGSRGEESPGLPPGFTRRSGQRCARNVSDVMPNESSGLDKSSALSTLQGDPIRPVQPQQLMWPDGDRTDVHGFQDWDAADKQHGAKPLAGTHKSLQHVQAKPVEQGIAASTALLQPQDLHEDPSHPSNGPETTGPLTRGLRDSSSDGEWACSPRKGVQSPSRETLGGSLKGSREGVGRGRRGGRRGRGRWRGRWHGRGSQGRGRHVDNEAPSAGPSMAGEQALLRVVAPDVQ